MHGRILLLLLRIIVLFLSHLEELCMQFSVRGFTHSLFAPNHSLCPSFLPAVDFVGRSIIRNNYVSTYVAQNQASSACTDRTRLCIYDIHTFFYFRRYDERSKSHQSFSCYFSCSSVVATFF